MNNAQFLQSAAEHCLKNGANLTDLRRQVLDLVLAHDGVVKAYQILTDLQQARGSAAPPTVYRALEFLVEQGILHRVEALNGYVVCRHLDCAHPSVIMTCRDCGKVDEMAADEGFVALRQLCAVHGFDMDEQQLLLNGRCVQCSEQIKKS
jgi:Fur family zinc uptake transcriptional regulator